MHDLNIDIETYSSVSLTKAGVCKYCQSPDFQILLFAYSLDGGEVQVIDLAMGETLPPWLAAALADRKYRKHAYNAAFEWICLSKAFGPLPLEQWRCTMVHALYCGYPAGLDAVGKALGLPEDKQKQAVGKALIRYFCMPCAPTKSNGGRLRNFPRHDPEKWRLFKEYCRGDVIAEAEILRRLSGFAPSDDLEKQWQTDMKINARGVAVDMDLVRGAIEIGKETREQWMREAAELSGVDNPNSARQLIQWLNQELSADIGDLQKETVSRLLSADIASRRARRLLEIRRELAKTSTKKYDAIEAAVCRDRRLRGLLQFYGASRTGRWAGRLVQVHNLPRTYVEPLSLARELVKQRKTDSIKTLYGSVADTLSQLIRTSLVAGPGWVLIDADFSAIEARVLAWLAGEEWRLEVFRGHGKIYEASAAQMFGVPLERIRKGRPEYALRQKGKVAELALGYQGGAGALVQMGALDMGLDESELPDIVNRWREANKAIRDLWYGVEAAAVQAIQTGKPVESRGLQLARQIDAGNDLDFLTIRLPSGRKLFYAKPALKKNRWDKPVVTYMGIDQTSKKWRRIETYGGKLVENCVQAIARDCLAEVIERLEAEGYSVVFHVHDEVVVECSPERGGLAEVTAIMARPMPWAPDLPLKAEGWSGTFYKKE